MWACLRGSVYSRMHVYNLVYKHITVLISLEVQFLHSVFLFTPYVCVLMCMCACVHVHACSCVYMGMCACLCARAYACSCASACAYSCARVYAYSYVRVFACMCARVCTCIIIYKPVWACVKLQLRHCSLRFSYSLHRLDHMNWYQLLLVLKTCHYCYSTSPLKRGGA